MDVLTERDIDEVLSYLHQGIEDCIYMYVDIREYGLDNPAMNVWISRDADGKLNCVLMKYHTGVSIYAKNSDYPLADIMSLLDNLEPVTISARKDIIETIHSALGDKYSVLYGYVFKMDNIADFGGHEMVELAKEEDLLECAKLMVTDEEISFYEVEKLADQLRERMKSGIGRNYILRDQNKIIGHIASYAEMDDIATTNALIVAHDYEGKMYGAVLESHLVNQLKLEGYTVYTYINKKKRYRLLVNMGNRPVSEYGKLMRTDKS